MFYVRAKYGDQYHIDGDGKIIRLDIPGFEPSGQWLMVGLRHVHKREFIPLAKLESWLKSKPALLYKNGNPQYRVRDFDHGSMREWGNGVADIYII
jgi:hypothetical protein